MHLSEHDVLSKKVFLSFVIKTDDDLTPDSCSLQSLKQIALLFELILPSSGDNSNPFIIISAGPF